jgi:hypothetical protein
VEGNEIVDQLAKRALKRDIIDINVPLGKGEAKCKVRAILICATRGKQTVQLKKTSTPPLHHTHRLYPTLHLVNLTIIIYF